MSRGGPLSVLDDATPLNGSTIDVGARIGWVARMARLAPQNGQVWRLEDLAKTIGTNITRLHRLETGQQREGALFDAYEQALELPTGSLRAPIDITCRTFRESRPDRFPGAPITTVSELSALSEQLNDALASGTPVSGGVWMTWARALSRPGAIGMLERTAYPLILGLIRELGRSVGHGYPCRYEALALLRCSDYGHLVLRAAQEVVADPDVQVLIDLMSAVGESVTEDALGWCLDLLRHDQREHVVIGAVIAFENMAQVSGPADFWSGRAAEVVETFNEAEPGTLRWEWFSHLVRLVPPAYLSEEALRPRVPLAPAADVKDWSRSRVNDQWSACQDAGEAACAKAGIPDQPMLARFIFDIGIGHYETRFITCAMLLGALPHLCEPVADALSDLAEHHPDPVIRGRIRRRLPVLVSDRVPEPVEGWLDPGHADLHETALRIAGAAGRHVPEETLRACIAAGGGASDAALYAAGMAQDPLLASLINDPATVPEVRSAARWWLANGGRVVS